MIKIHSETFPHGKNVAIINHMKNMFSICTLATGLLLAGCATQNKSSLTLDTVGPAPIQAGQTASNSSDGTLLVYSSYSVNANLNSPDPNRAEYSRYKILTADGNFLKLIHNDTGTVAQAPLPVTLPAGKYRVLARANGYGYVTVPVVVSAQQTTVVHLEGGDVWPDTSAFNQSNAVRLPDDQIIGWRAMQ